MRRLANLLIILAVVLCASHLSPAEAGDRLPGQSAALHHDTHSDDAGQPDGLAHAGHHHCPIAPDHVGAPAICEAAPAGALLFVAPIASLGSLSTAPPTEPPSA